MSKKLFKGISILIGISLICTLGGFSLAAKKELTPAEWSQLMWQDKLKKKDIVIRGYSIWSGIGDWIEEENLPTDVNNLREKIHSGDLGIPLTWYSIALFETAYPRVYIKPVTFNPWTRDAPATLIAKMSSGDAPSYYQLQNPREAIEKGLAADITDLVKENWHLFDEGVVPIWETIGWSQNRCYVLPRAYAMSRSIHYRKDFFEEAGIFNEKGVPGPPENWTWQDFREISKKLTDPKKQRWATGYNTGDPGRIAWDYIMAYSASYGWPITNLSGADALLFPDKTGKYTCKFGYIKPIAEAIKFFNEMRCEDNTLLVEEKTNNKANFGSGRIAMRYWSSKSDLLGEGLNVPHKYDPVKESKDILRYALCPTSEYGIQTRCLRFSPVMFDATINKEQLEAAFNWCLWNLCGPGFELKVARAYYLMSLGTPAGGWESYVLIVSPYEVEIPYGEKVLGIMKGKIPELLKNFQEIDSMERTFPYFFSPKDVGLELRNTGSALLQQGALRDALLVKKGLTMADIKEEMEKMGKTINRKMFNYKIKGDKEKWEDYFKAMDEVYKENYPKFYGSKDYQENFVNYFKIE